MHHAPRLLLPALALGLALAACNLLIGADDYSVGASWGCVGSGAPAATDAGDVTLTLHVQHLGGTALDGASVKACSSLDPGCSSAIGGPVSTDATGVATISVPSGFDGYLDLSGAVPLPDGGADAGDAGAATEPLMDTLIFVSPPPTRDRTQPDVNVGTYDEYKELVISGNGSVDPGTGALLIHTLDCLDQAAAGVTLSLDAEFGPGTDAFYFLNGSPVATQTQTDSGGIGGFADVMTRDGSGTPKITAALAANGETVAVFAATVRPMAVTEIWLSPNL